MPLEYNRAQREVQSLRIQYPPRVLLWTRKDATQAQGVTRRGESELRSVSKCD